MMSDSKNQSPAVSDFLQDVYQLAEAEKWEDVVASLNVFITQDNINILAESDPTLIGEAYCLLGVSVYHLGNLAKAIELFEQAQHMPNISSDVPEILAVLYASAGRLTDALFYGKLATVRSCDNKVLGLLGDDFPKFADVFLNINEKPLLKRAQGVLAAGRYAEALMWFEQQLSFDEQDVEALEGKARALLQMDGREYEAVSVLRYLRQLSPESAVIVGLLAEALTAIGNVFEAQACHVLATSMAPDDITLAAARFRDASVFPGEADVLCRKAYAALVRITEEASDDSQTSPRRSDKPIKIGYIVARLSPAQAEMVGRTLLWQDNEKVFYGNGELISSQNKPFQGCRAVWRNIEGLDPYTFAEVVRGDEVDILVNVSGWRAPEYLASHPLRPAPIQVSWMNSAIQRPFPGIDWCLSGLEGEKHWKLPHGAYVVNLDTLPQLSQPLERDPTLTFGADVALAFLTPDVALRWAQLLLAKPEARLVLRDHGLSQDGARQRLIELFGDFGVAHRIEIATEDDMAAFIAGLDLLLIPFREFQFGKIAAALLQKVPVIALDRTGRSLTPFLKAVELDQKMLASDEDEYVAKGLALCEGGQSFDTNFVEKILKSPIFDMKGLAGVLSVAFKEMLFSRAV